MTEKKYIELINKEVDGIINNKEKDQLHKYLEKDLLAQNHYLEAIKTLELLNQVADIDPSPNLKKKILNTIDAKRYTLEHTRNTGRLTISNWFTSLNPKLVYAFTAGFIIGLMIYSVFLTGDVQDDPLDNTNYFGTIGIPDNANIRRLDQISLDFMDVSGTVGMYKFNNIVWFDINLTHSEQCKMVLNFDQTNISFNGYKPIDYTTVYVENEKDIVTIHLNESGQFLLQFNKNSTVKTQIDLHIVSASEVPFTHTFLLSAEDGS